MQAENNFNGSCSAVSLPCRPGEKFIDPCSCTGYYVCADILTIRLGACPTGTAFDSSSTVICPHQDSVVPRKCNSSSPWTRCLKVVNKPSQIQALRKRCNNDNSAVISKAQQSTQGEDGDSNAITITQPSQHQQRGEGGGSNGGAIAGAVIAVIAVIVLVVLIVVYVRKKGNPFVKIKNSQIWFHLWYKKPQGPQRPPLEISCPMELCQEENVYASIDETVMYENNIKPQTPIIWSKETVQSKLQADLEIDELSQGSKGHFPPHSQTGIDKVSQKPMSYDFLNTGNNQCSTNISQHPLTGPDGYAIAFPLFDLKSVSCDKGPKSVNCVEGLEASYFVLEEQ